MPESETRDQTNLRLLRVIARARFEVLPGYYCWQPLAPDRAPTQDGLACVRDGDTWHEFVPALLGTSTTLYRVVSFHFAEDLDASGFVGWLATYVRRALGAGVVVICGKDRRDLPGLNEACQSVFDYWCCSVAKSNVFLSSVRDLIEHARQWDSADLSSR